MNRVGSVGTQAGETGKDIPRTVGPSVQRIETCAELGRGIRDAHDPLPSALPANSRTTPSAAAVLDLHGGEHCAASRAPVDRRPRPGDHPRRQHPQKELLRLADHPGRSGRPDPAPVVAEAQTAQIARHAANGAIRHLGGCQAFLFSLQYDRQAESVEVRSVQHPSSDQAMKPGVGIPEDVIARVTEMQIAVGERRRVERDIQVGRGLTGRHLEGT